MIDLILIAAFVGAFYLGFKAGNAYATLGQMAKDGIDKIRSAL